MKLNLILKTPPIEIILTLELAKRENVTNNYCFQCFSRALTCTLTLRLWMTQIYGFQIQFFRIFNSLVNSCKFEKPGLRSSECKLSFQKNQAYFQCVKVVVYSAQQTSTAKLQLLFLKFNKRTRVLRVNEAKPDTENTSNIDNFNSGVNKQLTKDEKALFLVSFENFDLYFDP